MEKEKSVEPRIARISRMKAEDFLFEFIREISEIRGRLPFLRPSAPLRG
jgi:hypothetical protein